MLAFSFVMPPKGDRGGVVVVLVLAKENLERMRHGDPFDLQFRAYDHHWQTMRPLRDVDLIIAYEEDTAAVAAFHERNDLASLMVYLERGRKHRPGDAMPPQKLAKLRQS